MMEFLTRLEETRLATSIAESSLLYPTILTLHGIGMALAVGVNTALSLCILGIAPDLPLAPMARFIRVLWFGFWLNTVTGILLVVAAATRVLTDPVFGVKMLLIGLALVNLVWLQREAFQDRMDGSPEPTALLAGTVVISATRPTTRARKLAIASFFLWGGAVTAGRLMGYTFFRFWTK